MFKTMVLGLDGSETSDHALEQAKILAREQGGKVKVVHVTEYFVGRGGGPRFVDDDEFRAKIERQTKDLVDSGIDAEFEAHSATAGGPAHVIADVAARANADLIITGTRGHTAAVGVVLGSVALRLLHLSKCPLLIIPPNQRPEASADRQPEVELSVD